MNRKEFNIEVLKEVEKIKKHANKKEISKLNFDVLNPKDRFNCIYGQMTGDCYGDRATTLINKCASLFLHSLVAKKWKHVKPHLSYKKGTIFDWNRTFTAVETYIALDRTKNKSLIKYLKGEVETWTP